MAHTGLQPDRTSGMGKSVDGQRPLRSALHLRHLWDGAVLHAHRHWNVCAALETARDSAAVSVHGLSLAARNLCPAGNVVDHQYDRGTSQRSARGHDHRAARSAGVPVLEAATPQKTGLTPLTNRILSKAGHMMDSGYARLLLQTLMIYAERRARTPSLHWTKSIPLREIRAYCGRPPPTSFTRNFTVPISRPAASARQLNSLIWSVFFGGVVNSTSIGKISPGESL